MKEAGLRAGALSPVVNVGKNGLTDGLLAQVGRELETKRLIKVKLLKSAAASRAEIASLAGRLAGKVRAELVEIRGRTITLHRQ